MAIYVRFGCGVGDAACAPAAVSRQQPCDGLQACRAPPCLPVCDVLNRRCSLNFHQYHPLPPISLQALALLDALAGGADPFWERYTAAVLPAPLALTLPLCFPAELLLELQHGAIIAAAQAQQQRLAALFPGLSGAMCEGEAGRWSWVGAACELLARLSVPE